MKKNKIAKSVIMILLIGTLRGVCSVQAAEPYYDTSSLLSSIVDANRGEYSFQAGYNAIASGYYSMALGQNVTASGYGSAALGGGTIASGNYAFAVGSATTASGAASVAIGENTVASGYGSVAMGNKTKASHNYAVAMGDSTISSAYASVAMGQSTQALADYAVAIGIDTIASGEASFAVGSASNAQGDNSTALSGGITSAVAANSAAIGQNATATLADSVALGSGSVANTAAGTSGYLGGNNTSSVWISTQNAISIGDAASGVTRQLTGLAAGTVDTDAVNVAQLKAASSTTAEGANIDVTAAANASGGTTYTVALQDDISLDSVTTGNSVLDDSGLTIGTTTFLTGTSLTIGGNTYVSTSGLNANSQKITNVAAGEVSDSSTDAVNGSQLYEVQSQVTANTTAINNIQDDITDIQGDITTIMGNITTITNSQGDLTNKADTDLSNITEDGKTVISNIAKESVKVLAGDNVTVTTGTEAGTNAATYTVGISDAAIQNAVSDVAVIYDAGSDKETVTLGGSSGTTITNLKAGEVSETSTDAVNGSQLYEVQTNVATNTTNITNLQNNKADTDLGNITTGGTTVISNIAKSSVKVVDGENTTVTTGEDSSGAATYAVNISDETIQNAVGDITTGLNTRLNSLDSKVDKVGAGAAAMAALHPLEYDPDDKLNFAVGLGTYHGQGAGALGMFYYPNGNTMVNLSASMGNGETMVGLGVAFALDGQNSSSRNISKKQLQAKLIATETKLVNTETRLANTEAEIQELKAMIAELANK